AEPRALDVDIDPELRGKLGVAVAVVARGFERLLERDVRTEQRASLRQLALEPGLAAPELAPHLVLPRRDAIRPAGDRVRPASRRIDGERAAPAVVAERLERCLSPAARAVRPVPDRGAEDVMSVAEDRRPHDDLLADDPFHRKAAAVDLRLDAQALDRRRRLFARGGQGPLTFARRESPTAQ